MQGSVLIVFGGSGEWLEVLRLLLLSRISLSRSGPSTESCSLEVIVHRCSIEPPMLGVSFVLKTLNPKPYKP